MMCGAVRLGRTFVKTREISAKIRRMMGFIRTASCISCAQPFALTVQLHPVDGVCKCEILIPFAMFRRLWNRTFMYGKINLQMLHYEWNGGVWDIDCIFHRQRGEGKIVSVA